MKHQEDFSHFKCSKNMNATHSCFNRNCQKYPFVCQSEECECHQQHKFCLMIKTETFIKSLTGKILPTQVFQSCIESNIDKLIDKLSNFRDKILIDIKTKHQRFGLSQNQKLILSQLKEGQTDKITDRQIWSAHLNFIKEEQIETKIESIIQNINFNLISLSNQIEKHSNLIHKIVKELQFQKPNVTLLIPKNSQKVQNKKLFFCDSILISNNEESQTLLKFFDKKIIKSTKSTKLLYRASENAFDIGKFRLKCHDIPNTLTLCETEFGKKIGGYTPIPWKFGQDEWVRDQQEESFLFSLSNNQKFILQDKNGAVRHSSNNDFDPTFGRGYLFGNCADFQICQKANQINKSGSQINFTYVNDKYKIRDKEVILRFNGNPQGQYFFKVKEWEVWQIEFKLEKMH